MVRLKGCARAAPPPSPVAADDKPAPPPKRTATDMDELVAGEKPIAPSQRTATATCTANGMYSYTAVMHGRALHDWVEIAHRFVARESQWQYMPLVPGAFGFDNFVMSIARLFEQIDRDVHSTMAECASAVHRGWAENYVWWRDYPPESPPYRAPANPLGDERRNELATTPYGSLPDDEQRKDRWIVKSVLAAAFDVVFVPADE